MRLRRDSAKNSVRSHSLKAHCAGERRCVQHVLNTTASTEGQKHIE